MRAVARGLHLQLHTVAMTPIALVTSYLTPLAVAFLVISRFGHPTSGLIVGAVTAAVLNALVTQTVFALREERIGGTMQVLAAAPTGLLPPLIGRLLGALLQGLVALPVTVAFVTAVWGVDDVTRDLNPGRVLLVLVGVLAAAVGVFAMAIFHIGLVIRSTTYVGLVNAVFPVAVVVMGLFIPLSALPAPLRIASWLLPPAWALEAVRAGRYDLLLPCAMGVLGWAATGFWLLLRLPSWLRTSPEVYSR